MSSPDAVELRLIDRDHRPDLIRLIDPYLRELSAHREHPGGPIDAASYAYLPLYWEESGRHPFFILSNVARAGFILVREVQDEGVIEMSDFYIQPEFRRTGVGRAALDALWRRFSGRWRLQVHPLNRAASTFWPRLIGEYATGPIETRSVIEEDGERREFSFEIPSLPATQNRATGTARQGQHG